MHYFYRYVCKKPSPPTASSDVEDIIARAVRLVEQRRISSGDSETNTNNDESETSTNYDEGERKINEKQKEAQLAK